MRSRAISATLALMVSSGSAFVPRVPAPSSSPPSSPSSKAGVRQQQPPQQLKAGERVSAVGILKGYLADLVSGSASDLWGSVKTVDTCLPQDPKADTEARKKYLEKQQEEYMWTSEREPVGLPFLDTKYEDGFPPPDDFPKVSWIAKVGSSLAKTILGTTRGTIGVGEVAEALSSPTEARNFANRISALIKGSTREERPGDIGDYEDLHAFPIKTPESVADYEDDDTFCRLRLQGPNCVVLEKCTASTRSKLKILDTDPTYASMKKRVDSLMEAGKLFVVDHELLRGMEASKLDGETDRSLSPSIALFEAIDDKLLPIKPIGIQLSLGDEATPIFTPEDGYTWMIAKSCFEAADFIIHEVVSHLGNTHCVLEGPMTAINRQLPKEHPINALMEPHVEGTALINWGAQNLLIVEGGGVDRLTANKIQDNWSLVLKTTVKRISKDFTPMADFAERGVTAKDFPGRYPYRDLGLKYYDATHTWVSEYLDIYYHNDNDVDNDYELQAFIGELVDFGAMAVADKVRTGSNKLDELKKLLASLIYTASTLHAAVNFPQKTIMSFAPMTPASVYQPPPTDKKPRSFDDYLAYLPPLEIATQQTVVGTLLGSIFHTKLGDYEADQFRDERVRGPLSKFQQALEEIEEEIIDDNAMITAAWKARGKGRKPAANFAYKTLLPDDIPQSINI